MRPNQAIVRLAISQALAGANSVVVYATGAVIGHTLSPHPGLATLPISIFVVGMALSTLPVGALVRRHGRHAAFLAGSLCGITVGLLASLALVVQSFALFCVAMLFGGAYAAVVQSYRFAAAETTTPERKAQALSFVMAGGVAAGIFGPQLVTFTMNWWPPHTFAITYIASAVVAALSGLVLRGVTFAARPVRVAAVGDRPIGEALRQPRLIVAMLCGVVSYMMMNFMMTSAPLAMELCGISQVDSNLGIEMHVIAMYAPSFFTGRLIARFGESRMMFVGLALTAAASLVGMSGLSVAHFWIALVLLGMGWNFGFLGASAMVLSCHTPQEAPRVQSVNDFVVFGSMVIGSFASGGLLTVYGWSVVTLLVLVPVIVAVAGLVWLQRVHVARMAPMNR